MNLALVVFPCDSRSVCRPLCLAILIVFAIEAEAQRCVQLPVGTCRSELGTSILGVSREPPVTVRLMLSCVRVVVGCIVMTVELTQNRRVDDHLGTQAGKVESYQ